MTVNDAVMKAIKPLITDEAQRVKIVNAVVTELDFAGWITTDNDHLAMMRTLLKVNQQAALDPEVHPRDLATLTNKVMALSKEVFTMEERARLERKQAGGRFNVDGTPKGDESFTTETL